MSVSRQETIPVRHSDFDPQAGAYVTGKYEQPSSGIVHDEAIEAPTGQYVDVRYRNQLEFEMPLTDQVRLMDALTSARRHLGTVARDLTISAIDRGNIGADVTAEPAYMEAVHNVAAASSAINQYHSGIRTDN